jgi:hypothetical protein
LIPNKKNLGFFTNGGSFDTASGDILSKCVSCGLGFY